MDVFVVFRVAIAEASSPELRTPYPSLVAVFTEERLADIACANHSYFYCKLPTDAIPAPSSVGGVWPRCEDGKA